MYKWTDRQTDRQKDRQTDRLEIRVHMSRVYSTANDWTRRGAKKLYNAHPSKDRREYDGEWRMYM